MRMEASCTSVGRAHLPLSLKRSLSTFLLELQELRLNLGITKYTEYVTIRCGINPTSRASQVMTI